MKTILVIVLALVSFNAYGQDSYQAQKERENKVLGAIAGGVLGSTIGQGDGKKAATVIGAILGFRHGDQILEGDRHHEHYRPAPPPMRAYRQADIYNACRWENPYHRDSRWFWDYQRGCVQRESDRLRQRGYYIEQQGYQGYNSYEVYEQGYRGQ